MTQDDSNQRTIRLYPWYKFFRSLIFWQAVWFLYFQDQLSAAAAILLYAIYDVATTVMELPSGWLSDRIGRRPTLILSGLAELGGAALLVLGGSFEIFAAGQILIGVSMAFSSGTDSALLYESLNARGKGDQVERYELRAWRFSFTALAISAVTGGLMSMVAPVLPFVAVVVAAAGLLTITFLLAEPPRAQTNKIEEPAPLAALVQAFKTPALTWLFVLSIAMYAFSHVPFVFGQPFILQALSGLGWDAEAPAVSGAVSAGMMVLSLTVSLVAPGLRARLGLTGVLLLAFGMQIALIGVLAISDAVLVIAILFLRMVPDSLSRPFIVARIQPFLADSVRATYLSLQSLVGRLLFSGSLIFASLSASDREKMSFDEISLVLGWYALTGLAIWVALGALARRVRVNQGTDP